MPERQLTFTSESNRTPVFLDLSDTEQDVIKAYREEYRRLCNSSISKKELPCGLSIKSGEAVTSTANLPSEDDLAILLHRLRPFILHKEPASFNRTVAVFGRHLRHPTVRAFLRELWREWKGERFFDEIALLQSTPIDGEKLLLDWLNAKEYHRDPAKAESVANLRATMSEPLVDFIIVSLALDKLRAVRKAAAVTRLILGELPALRMDGGRLEWVVPDVLLTGGES